MRWCADKKLNPVTYDYKTSEFQDLNLSIGLQYGFIAQEVQQVIPELVQNVIKPEFKNDKKDANSKGEEFATLNYTALIPILTKAIQEQQTTIEDLQKQINELKKMIPITTAKVGSD